MKRIFLSLLAAAFCLFAQQPQAQPPVLTPAPVVSTAPQQPKVNTPAQPKPAPNTAQAQPPAPPTPKPIPETQLLKLQIQEQKRADINKKLDDFRASLQAELFQSIDEAEMRIIAEACQVTFGISLQDCAIDPGNPRRSIDTWMIYPKSAGMVRPAK